MKFAAFVTVLFISCCLQSVMAKEFNTITIVLGHSAGNIEWKAAELLKDRLLEYGDLSVRIEREPSTAKPTADSLIVRLGIPAHHSKLVQWFDEHRIPYVTELDPGGEGFLIRSYLKEEPALLIAAAVDDRGALYAVGEILRQGQIHERSFELPDNLNIRTAPAFEIRGTQYGQSHIAKQKAHVREWTEREIRHEILDTVLAGLNTFSTEPGPMFDFIKSYGLMTECSYGANTGAGPPEWQAKESIGRPGYLCLSVPDAVQAQLERCDAYWKTAPTYDIVKFHGGDGGGCECDRCDPYGLTFIKVVEQMAGIIHKYHPTTRIAFTNQKFDNDDDNTIFKYLQEKPREWLWAWCYGPGSDAMSWQPGHRQTHRMDLFRHPGFGPFDRYNQEILHQLPPQQTLLHFNEITHWRYSQHGYVQMYPRADRNGDLPPPWNHFIYERRPDQALTMVYDRLTFYAWPRFYHWVFGEVVRYGVGDITHSSGNHDHFNQWMWQRLLWAPKTSVDNVVNEYCRTWFGVEAAPLMAEAIFLMEVYLEEDPQIPITEKNSIDRYYDLVREAGEVMPQHLMKSNWLWREYMQKGALDRYIKLRVIQQTDLQRKIERRIANALKSGELDRSIDIVVPWFDRLKDTKEMKHLREEAGRLGEESNALYGVRSEGYFNLDHDFIGLGWLKRQLERASAATSIEEQRELLQTIVDYEDPGEGGFYDNCGTFNPAPNVVKGYPYDHGQPYVQGILSEGNRPSQKSMHYTQDEAQGVTFYYRGLDPNAFYKIRFTFVRPWFQERYAYRMNQKSQSIYADDILLARDLELPYTMSDFFTFDIPQEATRDGELIVHLEKARDVAVGDRVAIEQWRNSGGWGTLVSEVWLMKKP